nr:MAG TPA: hypothetical protein [Caudoviricetes sp.]
MSKLSNIEHYISSSALRDDILTANSSGAIFIVVYSSKRYLRSTMCFFTFEVAIHDFVKLLLLIIKCLVI